MIGGIPGGPAVPDAARTVPPAPRPTSCDWPTPCTNPPTIDIQLLHYCKTHARVVEQNRQALIADRRLPELENWRDELLPPGGHWTPVHTVDTGGLL